MCFIWAKRVSECEDQTGSSEGWEKESVFTNPGSLLTVLSDSHLSIGRRYFKFSQSHLNLSNQESRVWRTCCSLSCVFLVDWKVLRAGTSSTKMLKRKALDKLNLIVFILIEKGLWLSSFMSLQSFHWAAWFIDFPQLGYSVGMMELCNSHRDFHFSLLYSPWSNERRGFQLNKQFPWCV